MCVRRMSRRTNLFDIALRNADTKSSSYSTELTLENLPR